MTEIPIIVENGEIHELQIPTKSSRTVYHHIEVILKDGENIHDYDIVFKKDIKSLHKQATQHLYYLKIILFFVHIFFFEYYKFSGDVIFIFSMITIVNIAFYQSLLLNISSNFLRGSAPV